MSLSVIFFFFLLQSYALYLKISGHLLNWLFMEVRCLHCKVLGELMLCYAMQACTDLVELSL